MPHNKYTTPLPALLGKTKDEMTLIMKGLGEPRFRASQLVEWLYQKRATTFEEMSSLPISLRSKLSEQFVVGRSPVLTQQISIDGTEKYLFGVHSRPDKTIETVYIPEAERATLCVSSQVGCKMNCKFCHTGRMGFSANLSSQDIINQVLSAPHYEKLSNIVFMGMGEPLDNYEEVSKAIEILTSEYGLGWSPKRITVSTIGPKEGLEKFLSREKTHLAISIHSPYSQERLELMPVERAFPISSIIETLSQYDFSGQRRLSFEYILFDGLNDSILHAQALVKLLRGLDCRVNLIRYHSIPGVDLQAPKAEAVRRFEDYLNAHGVRCTTRRSRGEDIFAACGMLSTQKD